MPVPKRKKSKSKRNMRRSHHALEAPALSACPRCKEPKTSHSVCLHCGYYKDVEVISMKGK